MAAPLLVNVVELLRRPGTTKDLSVSVAADEFAFADGRILDEPLEVRVHLESLSDGITVEGRITVGVRTECRRCLRTVEDRLTVPIEELFQVTVVDPDAYPIDQDQANLLPMVRENVLLVVPLAPLCRPDCAGLCSVCGKDLNDGACGCQQAEPDPRWAELESLKERLREDS